MIGGDYMDILFKTDDFVFSYRVGGILIHEGKILLQRPKNDNYAIIGGHVAAMETSMETLKREFEEEIHAKIEVDNLLAIGEIYFPFETYFNIFNKSINLSVNYRTTPKIVSILNKIYNDECYKQTAYEKNKDENMDFLPEVRIVTDIEKMYLN
jgi:8-oxo-dGTP pyrophosphatase MutT (NUDIX family)